MLNALIISRKSTYVICIAVLTVIILPMITMQFTAEVMWQLNDFIIASGLTGFAAYTVVLCLEKVQIKPLSRLMAIAVLVIFDAIWVCLATG